MYSCIFISTLPVLQLETHILNQVPVLVVPCPSFPKYQLCIDSSGVHDDVLFNSQSSAQDGLSVFRKSYIYT